jgi:hypothetical protein
MMLAEESTFSHSLQDVVIPHARSRENVVMIVLFFMVFRF